MIVMIYISAFCGLMCLAMAINYSVSNDKRARRLALRWLRHMLVFAGLGLIIVYLNAQ